MAKEKKKIPVEYFRNLLAVALADEIIHENELDFFTSKALEYGLTEEEVDSIIENANSLEFVPPSDIDKMDHLIDVVSMSIIDGEIHEKEYKVCQAITQKLGLTQKDLDDCISMAKSVLNTGLS